MNNVVKGLLGLGGVVLVGAAGFLGYVAMQPGELTVSRTVVVEATPADVRPFANDLKRWNEWSPWDKIDPDQKVAYSEPTAGEGAWYTWDGNDDVGKGKMTVVTDEPGRVVHRIAFEKPMEDVAEATIAWKATDATHTEVTWSFHQDAGFGTKMANVLMDIEGMLGKDYDKGVAQLEPVVEKAAQARIAEEERLAAEEKARAEAEAEGDGEEGEDDGPDAAEAAE